VLGLAILIPLSAVRSEALVEGFRLAFFGTVGIAACGVLISLLLMATKKPRA
jgi:hypothetical protein